LRDQGCRFPGCCETRFVDAHHVHHWCDGGETSLDNLVLLCRYHHRLLHQDGYGIEKGSAGFEFVRPDGRKLPRALVRQFAASDEQREGALVNDSQANEELAIESQHAALGLHIDSRTAVTRWLGESMDYSLGVGALMGLAQAPRHAAQIDSAS